MKVTGDDTCVSGLLDPPLRGKVGALSKQIFTYFPSALMLKAAGWRVEGGDNKEFLEGYHGNKEITGVDKQLKSISFKDSSNSDYSYGIIFDLWLPRCYLFINTLRYINHVTS